MPGAAGTCAMLGVITDRFATSCPRLPVIAPAAVRHGLTCAQTTGDTAFLTAAAVPAPTRTTGGTKRGSEMTPRTGGGSHLAGGGISSPALTVSGSTTVTSCSSWNMTPPTPLSPSFYSRGPGPHKMRTIAFFLFFDSALSNSTCYMTLFLTRKPSHLKLCREYSEKKGMTKSKIR